MSGTLGYLGLGVVLFAGLVVLALHNAGIRSAIREAVPEPLARFFSEPVEPAAGTPPHTPILEKAGEALRRATPPSSTADATFAVGSTKDEVRKAQGEPAHSTETVWTYGRSKVYFTGGRVASWSESSENPLRVLRQPL